MDGFKDTTRTAYVSGARASKGGSGAVKASQMMSAFKKGTLHMADGGRVDRRMLESTSARPAYVPLSREVPTSAERAAIERGNRAQALEAGERALLSPRVHRGVPATNPEPLIRGRK